MLLFKPLCDLQAEMIFVIGKSNQSTSYLPKCMFLKNSTQKTCEEISAHAHREQHGVARIAHICSSWLNVSYPNGTAGVFFIHPPDGIFFSLPQQRSDQHNLQVHSLCCCRRLSSLPHLGLPLARRAWFGESSSKQTRPPS